MNTEKQKFSSRLNEVLDEVGFPEFGQGRQTAIADLLDVKPELVGEWLKGESYPKTSKLVKLAQLINVRSNWLLSGIGEKYSNADDEYQFRQQLEERFPHKFKRRQVNAVENMIHTIESSAVDMENLGLNQDAIAVACEYMKLSDEQQTRLKTYLTQLSEQH